MLHHLRQGYELVRGPPIETPLWGVRTLFFDVPQVEFDVGTERPPSLSSVAPLSHHPPQPADCAFCRTVAMTVRLHCVQSHPQVLCQRSLQGRCVSDIFISNNKAGTEKGVIFESTEEDPQYVIGSGMWCQVLKQDMPRATTPHHHQENVVWEGHVVQPPRGGGGRGVPRHHEGGQLVAAVHVHSFTWAAPTVEGAGVPRQSCPPPAPGAEELYHLGGAAVVTPVSLLQQPHLLIDGESLRGGLDRCLIHRTYQKWSCHIMHHATIIMGVTGHTTILGDTSHTLTEPLLVGPQRRLHSPT